MKIMVGGKVVSDDLNRKVSLITHLPKESSQ